MKSLYAFPAQKDFHYITTHEDDFFFFCWLSIFFSKKEEKKREKIYLCNIIFLWLRKLLFFLCHVRDNIDIYIFLTFIFRNIHITRNS